MPETTSVALDFNDRLGRRIVLFLNNDQRCVTGAWIEEDASVPYDESMCNVTLYELLSKR